MAANVEIQKQVYTNLVSGNYTLERFQKNQTGKHLKQPRVLMDIVVNGMNFPDMEVFENYIKTQANIMSKQDGYFQNGMHGYMAEDMKTFEEKNNHFTKMIEYLKNDWARRVDHIEKYPDTWHKDFPVKVPEKGLKKEVCTATNLCINPKTGKVIDGGSVWERLQKQEIYKQCPDVEFETGETHKITSDKGLILNEGKKGANASKLLDFTIQLPNATIRTMAKNKSAWGDGGDRTNEWQELVRCMENYTKHHSTIDIVDGKVQLFVAIVDGKFFIRNSYAVKHIQEKCNNMNTFIGNAEQIGKFCQMIMDYGEQIVSDPENTINAIFDKLHKEL